MAQPQEYERKEDFTDRDGDDTNHGAINDELDAAALSINQIRDNLAMIQRDDGALRNDIVTAESLSDSAFDAVLEQANGVVAEANAAADRSTLFAVQAQNEKAAAEAARTGAQAAETNAAASAAAAATALDNFDDRYLGSKASNPTVDNDGNPLVTGAIYYRSTEPVGMKVWDGAQWIEASATQQASLVTFEFVATAGQTTFTGADANGVTLSYITGGLIVALNGVVLRPGDDYTATTGTSVVLVSGASVNDELCVFSFRSFTIADTYTQAQVDVALAGKAPAIGANWTFVQVGTELVASYNGTRRFKVDANGNAVMSGNVTAFGTV